MKVRKRGKEYFIVDVPIYSEGENCYCDEYGPYETATEAREDLQGTTRALEKMVNHPASHDPEQAFRGRSAVEKGVLTATFNGVELRVKNNEVWREGKRVAVYPNPPQLKNLLRLATKLKENSKMTTSTVTAPEAPSKKNPAPKKKRTPKKKSPEKAVKPTKKKTSKKSAKKAPVKKKSAKASAKDSAKASAKAPKEPKERKLRKWTEKKVAVFRALKKGEMDAIELKTAAKLDNDQQARHYAYAMKSEGLVEFATYEDKPNRFFFRLTAAGRKFDVKKVS